MLVRFTSIVFCLLLFSAAKSPTVSKGELVPEIELLNPEGKTLMLSKLKGKVVLVDFWASWCGPCRKENPNVVEAFKKYNKVKFKNAKGFEVFSVSLDKNESDWKAAIEKDGLVWKYHGWDKSGEVSKLYSVASIPSAFLIDGEGKLVAKGNELRGLGLHIALDELISN